MYKKIHKINMKLTTYYFTAVVQPLDWFEQEREYLLVMERTRNVMDLFDLINSKGPLPETEAKKIFKQVRHHLVYLSSVFLSCKEPKSFTATQTFV